MEAMQSFDTHANSKDRSVVVLKTSDVKIRGNSVFMPITIEMSQIKKPERGQFKKVEITKQMTERDVKEKLLATFPCLRNERFYCAAAVDNRTRLDFKGDRRIWDGRLIRRLLKGNSALYIFVDEQVPGNANMAPHSGASSRTEDAILVSSSHSLPIGSSVYSQESRFSTQPAQSTFCASSDSSSPVQLTTKRPPEQMTTAENELSNQTFKKLRATKGVSNDTERNVAGDLNAGTPLRALGTAKVQVIQTMEADAHGVHQGYRRETDEGAERISGGVSSEHKASRECQSFGTAAEERSLAVYAKGTNSRERCVTSVIERHQEGLETPGSDSESQLSDSSAPRPTDSGNETSASLAVSDANLRLQVFIDPPRVPFWKGGTFICFDFESTLPSHIQSGSAEIGNLKTVELHRLGNSLIGREIPARDNPGLEHITLRADSGETLGNTVIEYYDDIEESIDIVVKNKILHPRFFLKMAVETDAQNSESGGSNQPFETLKGAVCVAAKRGAMQFIKTVFSSKAGRAICKENPLLPQLIAREHGYEEIANYLEKMTTKFSKEAKDIAEEFHEIDWKELITLAEAAIEKEEWSIAPDNRTHPVENDAFESGYMGDTETSSSEMSPLPSSDSESDDSEEGFGDQIETESTTSSGSSGNYSYVESSQSPSNSSQNIIPIEEEREYDSVPEEETIRVIEPYPGSYCLSSHSELPVIKTGTEWNSQPSKGILASKGDNEFQQWSIESFFDDPDKFILEMNKTADLRKGQREQFILHMVLPHLEKSWSKCSSKNEEVYKILVQIGCSANSGVIIRHALLLFLHLICQEDFDSGNINLLVVEEITRSSIFMPEGVLRKSQHAETSLKPFVYCRILSWLLIQRARDVDVSFVALEQDLRKVQHELEKSCNLVSGRKKDQYRYSMEFISKAISQFRSIADTNLKRLIEECQQFCENSRLESGKLEILSKVKKNNSGEWVDLHCILIHLHGKVQSERPVPQMETERRAIKLIRLIVEAYVEGKSKPDWKFCLLVSSLLADTAINSVTKELRVEAGGCLVYLLKSEKVRKRPECRELLQRKCKEVLFCPDKETREFLVRALYQDSTGRDRDLQRPEPLPLEQLTEHLSSSYRTNTLEIKKQIISQIPSSFVKSGMFRSKKIAIKFLHVTKQHLREKDLKYQARERLNREVLSMRQLNASRHPNFPVLLAYDTKRLPYHIITAFEEHGDLLAFVQSFREGDPPVKHYRLLEMLKDVSDAILYLEGLGLVHRAVMAKNVLVGSRNCKLTGLHSTCRAFYTATDSMDGYCSAEVPDVPEKLPVRWKAPECLTRHRFTTASDVWAFGVLLYEVLTYGCPPYRDIPDEDVPDHVLYKKKIVPLESCFENEEYELIRQSCAWEINRRLKISQVSEGLQQMSRRAKKSGKEGLRHHPPPLVMQCTGNGSSDEELYDSIPEKSDELRMPVQESKGVPEECMVRPVQESKDVYGELEVDDYVVTKNAQGLTIIWEKLSEEEDKHIKTLNHLKNDHLFSEYEIQYLHPHHWMSWECPNGNLKEYVLDHRCKVEDIVMFLSQVSSALHYLHVNHIVHGDLRAEHVNIVATNKVQVGRLGRSKSLCMSEYEITSTSCVKGAKMPPNALRWSAPQVIIDGQYTHASDVWAFGILAWELYTSFAVGQQKRQFSVPYHELKNQEEILQYMADEGPLGQPDCCPDWVYKIIHQCWAYDSTQRPPFLAIVDCLTSREPMKSWMMQLWLQNHSESERPDLSIFQDGAHVLNEDRHPSKHDIERMCSEDYFAKHNYRYYSSRLSEKDKTLYSSAYSSPICLTEDETSSNKKMRQKNIVEYDVPRERKHVIGEINQNRGLREESRNKASGMDLQDCTIHNKATNDLSKDNKAPKMEHGDCFIDNKPISKGGQRRENQDTLAHRQSVQNGDLQSSTPQKEQDKCSLYDKPTSNPTATGSKNGEYQNALALQGSPNEALQNKTLISKQVGRYKRNKPNNVLGDKDENSQYENAPALPESPNEALQNKALKMEQGGCYGCDMPGHGGENREYENVQARRCVHITDDFQRKPTKMDHSGDCFEKSESDPTNTEVTDGGRKDQDYENVLAQRQVHQNGALQRNTPQNNYLVEEKGETAPAGRLTRRKRKYGNEENIQRNSTSAANQPKENEYAYANEQVTLEGRHLSMEDDHSNRMSGSHEEKIVFEYYV